MMTEEQYLTYWQREIEDMPHQPDGCAYQGRRRDGALIASIDETERAAPARPAPETVASTPRPSPGRLDALTARVEKLETRLDKLSTQPPQPPQPPDHPSPPHITGHMILDMVSFAFCVPVVDLTSRRKCKSAVLARQVAACLMRTLTSLTLPQIGRQLGGRDHTTIMHSISTITRRCETDTLLRAKVKHMEDELRKARLT
jgi:hypothetical protein